MFGAQKVCQSLLPTALNLARDPVPNLRFNVAKLFASFIEILPTEVARLEIRPNLVALTMDTDDDVRYFAQQALDVCDSKK